MSKFIAVLNVVAWAGFWAFGYLALTTDPADSRQLMIATLLAFAGAAAGMLAYFWLVRHAENTGIAKPSNRVLPEHHRQEN